MRLIWIGLAWVAGIFTGSYFNLSWFWMLTGLVPLVFCFFLRQRVRFLITLALVLTALAGGMAYYPASLPRDTIQPAAYAGRKIEFNGFICQPPEVKDQYSHITLMVNSINGQTASGRVLLLAGRYPEYRYGDILLVRGTLSAPPRFEGFDYQAYLAQQAIFAIVFSPDIKILEQRSGFSPLGWIYDLRGRLSDNLVAVLPEPQAGLAQGIFLGIRNTISPDLREDLAISGGAHLIAISGINLSLIAGMVLLLGLRLFGRRHYYYIWLSLTVVWFYSILSGLQAPVVRAAIMASAFLAAEFLGRQKWAAPVLALSAAIMVGIDPQVLWSVSFQLSFLAMAGLIFISPVFQEPIENFILNRWGEDSWPTKLILPVTDSFSVSLGAMIAFAPVLITNFGQISLVGPLTTLLVAPVITPIIILCALTALVGIVSLPAAQVIGWAAWLFISFMLVIIRVFASLPLAALPTSLPGRHWVVTYYGLIVLLLWLKPHIRSFKTLFLMMIKSTFWQKFRPENHLSSRPGARPGDRLDSILSRLPWKLIIVPLLLVAILTTLAAATLPDSDLHVSFLDVGEGDAILIQTSGQYILVDGGPSPQQISRELSRQLPFWERRIDMLILTHPHQDHLSGLVEVVQRYQIGQILTTAMTTDNALFRQWQSLLQSQGCTLHQAVRGQQISLNNDAVIDVLNPPDAFTFEEDELDENAIVLKIRRGQHAFLLTADISRSTELQLLTTRSDVKSTVLKAGHHGSNNSTSTEFLTSAQPQYVVISCGKDNSYGHPAPQMLDRIANQTVYRTDLDGTIEFTSDGENLWVKTAR